MSPEERAERNTAIYAADAEQRDREAVAAAIAAVAHATDDELNELLAGVLVGLEAREPAERERPEATVRLRAIARLLRLSPAEVEERRRQAVTAARAADEAAKTERDKSRPPMNVEHPGLTAPFLVRRGFTRGGQEIKVGDVFDAAAWWWPTRRLQQMLATAGRGYLVPHPDHIEACARAVALNGGNVPTELHDIPVVAPVESPEDRARRLARERQARRRERLRATA